MIDETLKRIQDNPAFLKQYYEGITLLSQSGLIAYLDEMSDEHLHNIVNKDTDKAALAGAYAAGWRSCLQLLLNFREIKLDPLSIRSEIPRSDYGSLERAVESGDLLQEEADAIKLGQQPNYAKFFTKPDKPNT